MKVIDAIKKFDGLVPPNWCNLVIDFINQTDKKNLSTAAGLIKDIRNVEGFHYYDQKYSLDYPKTDLIKQIPLKIFYLQLQNLLKIPLLNYTSMFPQCIVNRVDQIDFLKYGEGGKYEQHIDRGNSDGSSKRYLTGIINLNSDYEGGEFVFFNPSIRKETVVKEETLKQGSVLLFPSNFLFPHSIKPITKGRRYSLVCWME